MLVKDLLSVIDRGTAFILSEDDTFIYDSREEERINVFFGEYYVSCVWYSSIYNSLIIEISKKGVKKWVD